MADFTVTEVIRSPSRDASRAGKYDRLVFYRPVNAGKIRLVVIPDESFSEAAVRAAIVKDQAQISSVTGTTFTV